MDAEKLTKIGAVIFLILNKINFGSQASSIHIQTNIIQICF